MRATPRRLPTPAPAGAACWMPASTTLAGCRLSPGTGSTRSSRWVAGSWLGREAVPTYWAECGCILGMAAPRAVRHFVWGGSQQQAGVSRAASAQYGVMSAGALRRLLPCSGLTFARWWKQALHAARHYCPGGAMAWGAGGGPLASTVRSQLVLSAVHVLQALGCFPSCLSLCMPITLLLIFSTPCRVPIYPAYALHASRWLDSSAGAASPASATLRLMDSQGLASGSRWSPGQADAIGPAAQVAEQAAAQGSSAGAEVGQREGQRRSMPAVRVRAGRDWQVRAPTNAARPLLPCRWLWQEPCPAASWYSYHGAPMHG